MQLSQIDIVLFRLLYLSAGGIILFQVLGLTSLVSLLFALTFLLVAAIWFLLALREVTKLDILILGAIVVSLLHVLLNTWLSHGSVSFGYLRKLIIFTCTLLYFGIAGKALLDEGTKGVYFTVNTTLALFLTAWYFLAGRSVFLFNGMVTNYLTFGFNNPNQTAMFLLCLCLTEYLHLFRDIPKGEKAFHLLLTAVLLWLLVQTLARTSLLAALAVIGLCLLLFRKKGFRISRPFALLIAVFPILVAAGYMLAVKTPAFQRLFSFLGSGGKDLDTRVIIWTTAFQHFVKSPLLGNYNQLNDNVTISQMHNTHVDIMVTYGLPVLVLVCWILYWLLRDRGRSQSRFAIAAAVCFAGMVVLGMGEAAVFSGGLGIYLFAGAFLLLGSEESQNTIMKG